MSHRSATLVAGLGFGDEGKGATVDVLSRRLTSPLVIRHHGGPQAAHNVWTSERVNHTFAQFGAGTLAGAPTHLSRFMLVNPLTWVTEYDHLFGFRVTNVRSQMTVEEEAVVITPYHRVINRLREAARGHHAHGTTGHGVGEAVSDVLKGLPHITVGDLLSVSATCNLLEQIDEVKREEANKLGVRWLQKGHRWWADIGRVSISWPTADAFLEAVETFLMAVTVVDRGWLGQQSGHSLIFEGAQGVLLDQDYGFHPHTTWSDCTFNNAETLIEHLDLDDGVTKFGVLRSYMTRHGAGPFPTEDLSLPLPEQDNSSEDVAGAWRVGHPDPVLWRYALAVLGGVDYLAVTHLDRLLLLRKYAYAYRLSHGSEVASINPFHYSPRDLHGREGLTHELFRAEAMYDELPSRSQFTAWLEEELETPVVLTANGRMHWDRKWISTQPPLPAGMVRQHPARWTQTVWAPLLNG